jgi:hypothetical protein
VYSVLLDADGMIFERRGMARGKRRPTRHKVPNAPLVRMMSSRISFERFLGAAGSSVRRLRFVSAHRVWGTQ